jgi:hypothetical protein
VSMHCSKTPGDAMQGSYARTPGVYAGPCLQPVASFFSREKNTPFTKDTLFLT